MGGGPRDIGFSRWLWRGGSCFEVDLIKMVWVDGSEVLLECLTGFVGNNIQNILWRDRG